MPSVLVVHHTPSPALQELLESVREGIHEVEGVDVALRPALVCSPLEVLEADGYILGTTANIGFMSGALKHFFDQIYYPCLEATIGRPYGLYVHGASDTTGAVRSVERIVTALRWRAVRPPVDVVGLVGAQQREACWELGGLVAASVAGLA